MKTSYLILLFVLFATLAHAQSVGINTNNPDPSAALDIQATNKGLLVPRMNTSQREGIKNAANGLLVYDTDTNSFWYFHSNTWVELTSGAFEEDNGTVRNVGAGDNVLLFGSMQLPANQSTSDTLFFFNRDKAALRTGRITNSITWSPDSVGSSSIAAGYNTMANGNNASAFNQSTIASGSAATAFGFATQARGSQAAAFGSITKALGGASFASGSQSQADAYASAVFGRYNVGGGNPTLWVATDPLFEVGIGTSGFNRENALTILKDGSISFRSYAFPNTDGAAGEILYTDGNGQLSWVTPVGAFEQYQNVIRKAGAGDSDFVFGMDSLPADGFSHTETLFMFDYDKGAFRTGLLLNSTAWNPDSIGLGSFAAGLNNQAKGSYSAALGGSNLANSNFSMAWGSQNTALGSASTVWGVLNTSAGYAGTAFGAYTQANGDYSTAWGFENFATGQYATSWGRNTQANGALSTAWGYRSEAEGLYSTAWGNYSTAMGEKSTAWGDYSYALGEKSTAWGDYSVAYGQNSTAWGEDNLAKGWNSTAAGIDTEAEAFASFAIGRYNTGGGNDSVWIATDPLFEVGIGSSPSNRENGLTVFKNGAVAFKEYAFPVQDGTDGQVLHTDGNGQLSWSNRGVFENVNGTVRNTGSQSDDFVFGLDSLPANGVPYTERLFFFDESKGAFRAGGLSYSLNWATDSLGSYSVAMGNNAKALGNHSFAFGSDAKAQGAGAIVIGATTSATALSGVAIGEATSAEGNYALALGRLTRGIGVYSTAMGFNTNAHGAFSTATGQYTDALAFNDFVIGRYNIGGGNTSSWVDTDPLFEIGNGSGYGNDASNALTVLKNGKTGIGTHTPDEALSVVGTVRAALEETETNYIELGHGGNNAFINAEGVGNIDIRHGTLNIMTLTSGQRVGIRTNNPEADLHIRQANSVSTGGLMLENSGGNNNWARFYVANSTGHLRIYTDDTTSHIGFFDDASGVYSATSDRRLKEDFEPLHFDWNTFMELQPLTYQYRTDDSHKRHIGMVAQDVEQVYPELITYDSESDIYHMNYSGIGVVAVKALQEQRKEHETLKKQMQEKDLEIQNLRRELQELKQWVKDSLEDLPRTGQK